MNMISSKCIRLKAIVSFVVIVLVAGSIRAEDSLYLSVDTTKATYCDQPEARQFDFWLGEWNMFWGEGQNTETGTNSITSELRECMIEENFVSDGLDPFVGRSISVYDARVGRWKQTWTDNRGGYLDFVGGWEGDRMLLAREVISDSLQFTQRMVWYNITKSSLEWKWERSDDHGESWQLLWHISYSRQN